MDVGKADVLEHEIEIIRQRIAGTQTKNIDVPGFPQLVQRNGKILLQMICEGGLQIADVHVQHLLQELRARHIKVPEQVKLASFYDSELLTSSTPQISAAQFDGERLGATACRMLLDILAGKQIALRQMQGYQVILRESTK